MSWFSIRDPKVSSWDPTSINTYSIALWQYVIFGLWHRIHYCWNIQYINLFIILIIQLTVCLSFIWVCCIFSMIIRPKVESLGLIGVAQLMTFFKYTFCKCVFIKFENWNVYYFWFSTDCTANVYKWNCTIKLIYEKFMHSISLIF